MGLSDLEETNSKFERRQKPSMILFFIEMYFSCTKKITTHCESYTTYGSLILFVIGVGKAIQFNAQEKLESVQIDPNLTQYADDTTVFV